MDALPASLGALSTACSPLAQVLPPLGTKSSPHSGMPTTAAPAGLPLWTLHRLQHGSNLQQICLFGDHTDRSL